MPNPYVPNNTHSQVLIHINGQDSGLGQLIKEVYIVEEANKITSAKIKFTSTNIVTEGEERAALSDLNIYEKNDLQHIAIYLMIEGELEKIFEGIIRSYNKQIEGQEIIVQIECKDLCVLLTNNLSTLASDDASYNDTCEHFVHSIGATLNNIDIIDAGKELILYNPSTCPWDYIVGFADSVGYWTSVKNGDLKFVDFNKELDPKYIADNSINVFEFKAKIEPSRKKSKISLSYWDVDNLSIKNLDVTQTAFTNEEIINATNCTLYESTYQCIIDARLRRSFLASTYGYVATFGNSIVTVGDYIQTKYLNSDLDGKNLIVSKIEHQIQEGNWRTTYHFGLEKEDNFLEGILNNNNVLQNQIGQTNTIEGLMIGIVTELKDDPNGQDRIKIKLPLINNDTDGIWARISNLFATNNGGAYFIPDVGDEVVVGFIGNNLDNPIILGSMYSQKHNSIIRHSNNNAIKGIYTPAGSKIEWNDGKKSIQITNSSDDSILISEDEKGILISDQNLNLIRLNNDGIKLESPNDIEINAGSNLRIQASSIEMASNGDIKLAGSIIKLN